jgi:hypothetical protein
MEFHYACKKRKAFPLSNFMKLGIAEHDCVHTSYAEFRLNRLIYVENMDTILYMP